MPPARHWRRTQRGVLRIRGASSLGVSGSVMSAFMQQGTTHLATRSRAFSWSVDADSVVDRTFDPVDSRLVDRVDPPSVDCRSVGGRSVAVGSVDRSLVDRIDRSTPAIGHRRSRSIRYRSRRSGRSNVQGIATDRWPIGRTAPTPRPAASRSAPCAAFRAARSARGGRAARGRARSATTGRRRAA